MNRTFLPLLAAGALLLGAPLQAANLIVTNNLPGNVEYDGWDSLTAGTPGLTTTVLSTAPGFGSNEAGSGDATFLRTSGGHYPAGSSLYSFSVSSTFKIADSTLLSDVKTVVLSVESWSNGNEGLPAGSFTSLPVLNFNGGSQALAADYQATVTMGTIDFGGPTTTYGFTFQWDLTSIGDNVTSYDVDWGQLVHAGLLKVQLESSDQYAMSNAITAVPEPSTYALIGLAMGAMVLVRRRKLA